MAEKEEGSEMQLTGRARVRAKLIEPLVVDGMRFRHGTPEKTVRARLDAIADDLAYMSDGPLAAMRNWLGSHGEGSARCFWPSRVSINSTAEAYEKRPLEEIPALLRWFASNAGRMARDADRLVAEYEFFSKHKRPPRNDNERAKIHADSQSWARDVELTKDRLRRGVSPPTSDIQFLNWYETRLAYVSGLVGQEYAE